MARDEVKPWHCAQGHVMGQTFRNGRGITQLLLYRHSVDSAAAQGAEVDVMGVLEGLMLDVKCDICGGIRTWVPGEAAMKRLLRQMGKSECKVEAVRPSR